MRLIVQQTECAGKMFWIVQDAMSWHYHGPFADEAAARAFARAKNSEAWKELLRKAREARKMMAAFIAEEANHALTEQLS
jgi:hypothetical protein